MAIHVVEEAEEAVVVETIEDARKPTCLYYPFKWSEEGRDVELRGKYFSCPTPFKVLEIKLVNTVQIDSLYLIQSKLSWRST
jgi:hypothetical protein